MNRYRRYQNALHAQARRLVKFVGDGWTPQMAMDYLSSLSTQGRHELWEDIRAEMDREARPR